MGRAWSSDFTTTERQRAPGPRSSSSARSTTAAWFERVREACNDTPGPYQAHPHPQTPPQNTHTHARTHAHTQHAQSLSQPPTHTQSPYTHAGRAVPHRGPRAAPAPDRARAGSPLAEAGCPRYRHRRRPPPRSPIRRLRPRPRPRRRRRSARSGGRRGQRRGTAPGPTRSPARRTCPARPAVITRAPPDTCRRARFHAPQRAGIRDISKHRDVQMPARCGAWNGRELAVICIGCVFRGGGGGCGAVRWVGWGGWATPVLLEGDAGGAGPLQHLQAQPPAHRAHLPRSRRPQRASFRSPHPAYTHLSALYYLYAPSHQRTAHMLNMRGPSDSGIRWSVCHDADGRAHRNTGMSSHRALTFERTSIPDWGIPAASLIGPSWPSR
jgi:hypothetical protein